MKFLFIITIFTFTFGFLPGTVKAAGKKEMIKDSGKPAIAKVAVKQAQSAGIPAAVHGIILYR